MSKERYPLLSRSLGWLAGAGIVMLAAQPVFAVRFESVQIYQVIGGVNGDTSVQAVELRLRFMSQNLVSQARLLVRDASGSNPIVVLDIPANVANNAAGARILIATSNLPAFTMPPRTPDFVMTTPIPAAYIPAGSLTYESDGGVIYWRVSWGGANYTGPGSGDTANDADGNFNPPFPGPLPTCTTQALQFRFNAAASSTNNSNDYQLSAGAAVLGKNDGSVTTVTGPAPSMGACCAGISCTISSSCSCTASGGTYQGDGSGCSPNPCIAPPAGSARSEGLLADKVAGGDVVLNWNPSCLVTDTDYAIYEGTLGSFYSHQARFCTTGGATTETFTPRAGNSYYLIVPLNTAREGSYGTNSNGIERPAGQPVCLTQQIASCP